MAFLIIKFLSKLLIRANHTLRSLASFIVCTNSDLLIRHINLQIINVVTLFNLLTNFIHIHHQLQGCELLETCGLELNVCS